MNPEGRGSQPRTGSRNAGGAPDRESGSRHGTPATGADDQPSGASDRTGDGTVSARPAQLPADPAAPSGGRRRRRRRKRARVDGKPAETVAAQPKDDTAEAATHRGKRRKNRRGKRRGPVPLDIGKQAVPAGSSPASEPTAITAPSVAPQQQVAPHLVRSQRAELPLYAALDLGTNNCRLLVATPTAPGRFRVIDAFSRIVRLGEGLTATGRLSDEAMERALGALRQCAAKLATRPVRAMRLVATEACRAAENGQQFLDRVREETGLVLEVVDRETEARLAVSGCDNLVGREIDSVVLFDIGGGSSEIALLDVSGERRRRLSDHISAWTSLPVGVVSIAERFGGRDVTRTLFDDMIADVRRHIEAFEARGLFNGSAGGDGFHLLGTSGTVTTLAGLHLELPRYDRRRVDGIWLTDAELTTTTDRLLSWSFEERVANACIGPDRADLVLAGCAILEAIRQEWPSRRLRVADRGLREGILTELMAADGAWRRKGRFRRRGRGHGQ